ncbi:MAG: hypothetical protein ABR576_10480 [Thermoanaerobaculia bacterium]
MPVTVKRITLWRRDTVNRPGTLAGALEPLARAGADLRVVMAYRYPEEKDRAAVEIFPITGRKGTAAAAEAGLQDSGIPTLLVEGDDRPATGHAIARAIADAGINLAFFVAQVIGRKYSAVIGFEDEEDASRASALIKKAKPEKGR